MKYTQIPQDTFKNLQLNAGIFTDSFDPDTQEIGNILMATTGGATFTATPTYSDFGEDIDNCPTNMMELKKLDSWEAKMSGTSVTVNAELARAFVGAADVSGKKIIPRGDLKTDDFCDLWWIGDYSEINEDGEVDGTSGYLAIHMMHALSTGGFQLKSTDKGKGNFAFEYLAHYSMEKQDTVPFEIYIEEGKTDAAGATVSG